MFRLNKFRFASFNLFFIIISLSGERRIRVHTLALPVTTKLADIYAYADQEAVALSLSKLGRYYYITQSSRYLSP